MAFKIEITELAKKDLYKGVEYYNKKAAGLGIRFYKQHREAIKKLKLHPLYYSYYKAPFRRILIDDFSYLIVYKINDNTVVITAIIFSMIDPDIIDNRTK